MVRKAPKFSFIKICFHLLKILKFIDKKYLTSLTTSAPNFCHPQVPIRHTEMRSYIEDGEGS